MKNPKPRRSPTPLKLSAALILALSSTPGVTLAGTCVGAAGTYNCSGAETPGTDTTQPLTGGAGSLTVTTSPGFGINTSAGNAFSLTGATGVSFIDLGGAGISGNGSGIRAINLAGNLTVTTTGLVTGLNDDGIYARNGGTDLSITTGDVSGFDWGILALNDGTGALTIDSSGGSVSSVSLIGVGAVNFSGTNLTVTTADVTAGGVGISVGNQGSGSLTIDSSAGSVSGNFWSGIRASNDNGTNLSITTSDVYGRQTGIYAINTGSGSLSINSVAGTVRGVEVNAITAYNSGTDLSILTADIEGGIFASQTGTGVLSITTTAGTVNGHIFGRNVSGSGLTITTADVNGIGVGGVSYGSGTLIINTVAGTINGTSAYAVAARSHGSADIFITTADVTATNDGVHVQNEGTGAVTIDTTQGTATGTSNNGVFVNNHSANSGDVSITTADSYGRVYGIAALNYGLDAALIIDSTAGNVSAAYNGMVAYTYGAELIITTSNVSGGWNGIRAIHLGSGPLVVTTTGTISGSDYSGIETTAIGGSTSINIGNTSIVSGAYSGIHSASGGGNIAITNDGTIQNLSNASFDRAITATGGPVNISNRDLITGSILLGDLNNTFNNGSNGVWNTTGSNNVFGAGIDVVNNGGNIVAGNAANTASTTFFTGLETFNNNVGGTLQMQDGGVGDVSVISGNFNGNGGFLGVDVALTSDVLVIQGNSSGNSYLSVNNTGMAGALTNGDGIRVVQVDGASAAGAFSLANSNGLNVGIFQYRLYQNGISNPTDGDWYLRSTIRSTAPSLSLLPNVGNEIALSTLGTFHERVGEHEVNRNGVDNGGIWSRIVGSNSRQTYDISGVDFSSKTSSLIVQTGLDLYRSSIGDSSTVFGLSASKLWDDLDVGGPGLVSSSSLKGDGWALGAYATHYTEKYYLDAALQYSWLDNNSGGSNRHVDTRNWLASFEAGRQFRFNNAYTFEPQAQIIYGKSDTGDANDGIADYRYDTAATEIARAGFRLLHEPGKNTDKSEFVPFVKANVWRNFGGQSSVSIDGIDVLPAKGDSWADLGIGFNLLTRHNWIIQMQYDYQKGFSDSGFSSHQGTFGIRKIW